MTKFIFSDRFWHFSLGIVFSCVSATAGATNYGNCRFNLPADQTKGAYLAYADPRVGPYDHYCYETYQDTALDASTVAYAGLAGWG